MEPLKERGILVLLGMPLKMRAHVRRVTGRTTNVVGIMKGGEPVIFGEAKPAAEVEIVDDGDWCWFFRYAKDGDAAGDSCFVTLDEAKAQALFEFAIEPDDWVVVED